MKIPRIIRSYIFDASGVEINPATQETLMAIKNTDGVKKITDTVQVNSPVSIGNPITTPVTVGGQDSLGKSQSLEMTPNGSLRVAIEEISAANPQTMGSNESKNNRAYQTTKRINLATSGVEQAMILFRNPSGSGKKVQIREITFGSVTTGSSKSITVDVYENPFVTAFGATEIPTSMNIGGGAPVPATLASSSPTATSFGIRLTELAATNEQGRLDYDWGLIINPNNSLLITGTPSAPNIPTSVNVIWTEVNI